MNENQIIQTSASRQRKSLPYHFCHTNTASFLQIVARPDSTAEIIAVAREKIHLSETK